MAPKRSKIACRRTPSTVLTLWVCGVFRMAGATRSCSSTANRPQALLVEAPRRVSIELEGRAHDIEVHRRTALPPEAPRLVVVSYQPNKSARGLLRACLDAIERFTPEPHEVWVVDNNSPEEALEWLRARSRVNLAFNRTEPAPPGRRGRWTHLTGGIRQQRWGSYSNAVGLELGARLVDPQTTRLMTLHMDTAPCRAGWLSYLNSKIDGPTAAAGVRLDRARVADGVLHVLGCLADNRRVRARSIVLAETARLGRRRRHHCRATGGGAPDARVPQHAYGPITRELAAAAFRRDAGRPRSGRRGTGHFPALGAWDREFHARAGAGGLARGMGTVRGRSARGERSDPLIPPQKWVRTD